MTNLKTIEAQARERIMSDFDEKGVIKAIQNHFKKLDMPLIKNSFSQMRTDDENFDVTATAEISFTIDGTLSDDGKIIQINFVEMNIGPSSLKVPMPKSKRKIILKL